MINQCLVDKDGVLADFVSAACAAHGVTSPYFDRNEPPPFVPAKAAGVQYFQNLLGLSTDQFYAPLCGEAFWRSVPVTSEAASVVSLAAAVFTVKSVHILGGITMDSACASVGYEWVVRFFPQFIRRVTFSTDPATTCSGVNRLLISSREDLVDRWRDTGSPAVLFARPWNRHWKRTQYAVSDLRSELELFKR